MDQSSDKQEPQVLRTASWEKMTTLSLHYGTMNKEAVDTESAIDFKFYKCSSFDIYYDYNIQNSLFF